MERMGNGFKSCLKRLKNFRLDICFEGNRGTAKSNSLTFASKALDVHGGQNLYSSKINPFVRTVLQHGPKSCRRD